MIVLFAFIIFVILAFFIPKKHLGKYFVFGCILLSVLYFFFYPPVEYDLYRHYEMGKLLRKYDFWDIVNPTKSIATSNYVLNRYLRGSRVFVIFAYVIENLNINHLLAVVSCLVTYGLVFRRIWKNAKENGYAKGVIIFTLIFFLCCFDYRSISGIRNAMAYAMFSYVVYEDVVNRKNRVLCFAAYFLLCQFHLTILIFTVFRITLLIINKYTKAAILAIVFFAFAFSDQIASFLSSIPRARYFAEFAGTIKIYLLDGTDFSIKRASFRALVMIIYMVIFLVSHKEIEKTKGMKQYGQLFLISLIFTFGSIRQYDLFMRNDMLLLMLLIPYILSFSKRHIFLSNRGIVVSSAKIGHIETKAFPLIVLITMLMSIAFYVVYFYVDMDPYFKIW